MSLSSKDKTGLSIKAHTLTTPPPPPILKMLSRSDVPKKEGYLEILSVTFATHVFFLIALS